MTFVLFLLKLAAYAFCLSVVIRQSYNLVFALLRKPLVWIITMGVIGFAHFATAGWIGASVSLPFWATVVALIINLPPDPSPTRAIEREINVGIVNQGADRN